jgi:type II secretory pathway component GspD/PulD (secretin)
MRLYFTLSMILALVFYLQVHAAQSQNRLQYLTEPLVKWENNRVSGEVKNVPVSGLLQELVQGRNSGCRMDGVLQGTISISFENLDPEDIIRKIMRNLNYNYTMIVNSPEPSDSGGIAGVSQLTIYQGSGTIRFRRVPLKVESPAEQPERISPLPARKASGKETSQAEPITGGSLEALDTKIKEFMDDMLSSGKINKKEYDKALSEVIGTED